MKAPAITLFFILLAMSCYATQESEPRFPTQLISNTAKTAPVDTIFLIGEPGSGTGDFQTENPTKPDWEDWTPVDRTTIEENKWHIDAFNAELLDEESPNHALYCGEVFTACSLTDPVEGYGHSYKEYIDWWGTVTDASAATTVTVSGILNYDNEPGYDYLYLRHEDSTGWNEITFWNGSNFNPTTLVFEPVSFSFPIPYAADSYVGENLDQVHLRFSAESDGAWDDADCLWPTSGLAQIDNLEVDGDNGLVSTFDDFESDLEASYWTPAYRMSYGNYGHIWPILDDIDPCRQNNTPQVAFIDDGVVEDCDGTDFEGTLSYNWTYGPDGFCVNNTGGCQPYRELLDNEVWSPVLEWPVDGPDGAELSFDVYQHSSPCSYVYPKWAVQCRDQAGQWGEWQYPRLTDYAFMVFDESGNKRYIRRHINLTGHLIQNVSAVRIALGAAIYPIWCWGDTSATPAPYFDNVALRLFPTYGPKINTFAHNLAQNGFPASGDIDGDPQDLSIRFDMSADILGDTSTEIVAGDSIAFSATAVRGGSELNGLPKLHYILRPNPNLTVTRVFALQDSVDCPQVLNDIGEPVSNRFCCDLPDSGFLFPGDVLHYYISSEDIIDGDPGTITRSTLPNRLDGYGVFDDLSRPVPLFPPTFTVRGLPTLSEIDGDWQNGYTQPGMLLWDDYGHPDSESAWAFALSQAGYHRGLDYDLFYTNYPSAKMDNGLGARTQPGQIDGYATMLYTSGDHREGTLGTPTLYDFLDKSPDTELLDAWLRTGGRNLLMTGNELLLDLGSPSGGARDLFRSEWLGVDAVANDVLDALGDRMIPRVLSLNDPALALPMDFTAYNECPSIFAFNQMELEGAAIALANFQDATGLDSGIPAITMNTNLGSRVVYSCVDFSLWGTPHDKSSARAQNLAAILDVFGQTATGPATDTPGKIAFFTSNHPNPFNPITKISFSVPEAGPVSVKIYNLRGEVVRTLVDEVMPVSALVTREWLGRDDKGRDVSSGVYFYEVTTKGHSQTKKMALIR
jgi:hypothetical protein